MIFIIDNINEPKSVDVYENILDITKRIEWQDILNNDITIIDEKGKIYQWDDSKKSEYGTIFDYSLKISTENKDLAQKCKDEYLKSGCKEEFYL